MPAIWMESTGHFKNGVVLVNSANEKAETTCLATFSSDKAPGHIRKPRRHGIVGEGVMDVWVRAIYLAWLSFGKIAHDLGGRGRPNAAPSWHFFCLFLAAGLRR